MRRHERCWSGALLLGLVLAGAKGAAADIYTVGNLNNSGAGSLRQAVLDTNAKPGADEIEFASGVTGTVVIDGTLTIRDNLKIDGRGANVHTIDGNKSNRIIDILPNITVTISDLTLANGKATDLGAGILNRGATLNLDNVTLRNNRVENLNATIGGGALAGINQSKNTITNSVISSNEALGGSGGLGGAIFLDQGSKLSLDATTLTNNRATGLSGVGGAGYFAGGSQVTMTNSILNGNIALGTNGTGQGGGLFITNSSLFGPTGDGGLFLGEKLTFNANQALGSNGTQGGPGAIGAGGAAAVVLGRGSVLLAIFRSCLFGNNSAKGGAGGPASLGGKGGPGGGAAGGALLDISANTIIEKSTFTGNLVTGGAGADGNPGGAGGSASGGALYSHVAGNTPTVGPHFAVSGSSFTDNRTTGGTGGPGGDGGSADGGVGTFLHGTTLLENIAATLNAAIAGVAGVGGKDGIGKGGGFFIGANAIGAIPPGNVVEGNKASTVDNDVSGNTIFIDDKRPGSGTRGTLQIPGNDGSHKYIISTNGDGSRDKIVTVTVTVDGKLMGTYPNVEQVILDAGGGNDTIVFENFYLPCVVLGGAGNDNIQLGNGANLADGGDGDDVVKGGSDQDVIIGGAGEDKFDGAGGDDLLIADHVGPNRDTAASLPDLLQLGGEWRNSQITYPFRAEIVRKALAGGMVHGDGKPDILEGGSGRDCFFIQNGDTVKDKKEDEIVSTID